MYVNIGKQMLTVATAILYDIQLRAKPFRLWAAKRHNVLVHWKEELEER